VVDDSYNIETPMVYNHSLDLIEEKDEIYLILVGDNPGKEEQKHSNQRYLVGHSGRVAEGFFKRHKELEIDFESFWKNNTSKYLCVYKCNKCGKLVNAVDLIEYMNQHEE